MSCNHLQRKWLLGIPRWKHECMSFVRILELFLRKDCY